MFGIILTFFCAGVLLISFDAFVNKFILNSIFVLNRFQQGIMIV